MPTIKTYEGNAVNYDVPPNICPFCHSIISPKPYYGYKHKDNLNIVFACPNRLCEELFIGYYHPGPPNGFSFIGKTTIGIIVTRKFSIDIETLSPGFVTIYNQAYQAEEIGLSEICGVGYRKALEFLIKDYIISINPAEKSIIESEFLGKCIKDRIDDIRIKSAAERATWIGNDETHYVRKWGNKDISDLKLLLKLTLHWIEMEILSKSIENEMPKS